MNRDSVLYQNFQEIVSWVSVIIAILLVVFSAVLFVDDFFCKTGVRAEDDRLVDKIIFKNVGRPKDDSIAEHLYVRVFDSRISTDTVIVDLAKVLPSTALKNPVTLADNSTVASSDQQHPDRDNPIRLRPKWSIYALYILGIAGIIISLALAITHAILLLCY